MPGLSPIVLVEATILGAGMSEAEATLRSQTIPESAEIVVVGGGVIGASALYHLATAGCTDCVLVERETLGAGSTGKAAGGIRAQFSDELNVRIALECIRRFQRFDEQPGAEIGFKQWGYLFLLSSEADVASFRASLAIQQRLGAPSRLLHPDEAAEIVPGIRIDDLLAATFCPLDGYATPEAVVQGYASAAARLGATIAQGCAAERILVERGRVAGVETPQGRLAADRVILAAGVWSRELAATAGVDLPIRAERRHVFFTEPGDPLPHALPLTIDFASGFYFHREGRGLLFGGREQTIDELAPIAAHRLPALAELGVRGGWWGYYEMSPDNNAVVGSAAEPEGLVYATGFSGHGFQQAPVIGEHVADLALGRPARFDLSPFSADRFAAGSTRVETAVV
jgi:sarcosine oxidase subunit beta